MLFSTQPVLDGRQGRSGIASGSTTSCFLGGVIVLQYKFLALRVHQFMQPFCQDLKVEEAHLLLMNQNYRLIKHVKLSQGGITETLMDIRLIMKYAVTNNATILTVVHNHPSENPRPSRVDDEITKSILNACKLMRVHFCDHVIMCSQEYYSYRENGKL